MSFSDAAWVTLRNVSAPSDSSPRARRRTKSRVLALRRLERGHDVEDLAVAVSAVPGPERAYWSSFVQPITLRGQPGPASRGRTTGTAAPPSLRSRAHSRPSSRAEDKERFQHLASTLCRRFQRVCRPAMHAHFQTDRRLPLSPVHTSSQPPDEPNPDLLAPECSRDYDPLQVDAVAYLGHGQASKGPSPLIAEWIQTELRYRNDSIPSLKAAVRSLLQTAKTCGCSLRCISVYAQSPGGEKGTYETQKLRRCYCCPDREHQGG